jgi:hypothetical protein
MACCCPSACAATEFNAANFDDPVAPFGGQARGFRIEDYLAHGSNYA